MATVPQPSPAPAAASSVPHAGPDAPHAAADAAPAPARVLVRGGEQLLVDRAIARVLAAARRAEPAVERRDTQAAGLSPSEFADAVSPSLFAEPRVVIVRGVHEAAKDLASAIDSCIDDPGEGVTLVLHHAGKRHAALADHMTRAGATVVTCEKITRPRERVEFVRRDIREAGGTTTIDAVEALVDAVGTDLAELASAASQLVADTGGMVDERAVRRYHRGRAAVSGFTVADLMVAGRTAAALEALRWALVVGEHPVRIADAIAGGISSVAKVAAAPGSASRTVAAEWGIPPWKVDKLRQVARAWTADGLAAAMRIAAQLNADVKGGAADPNYAMERAVLDIARVHRR